jgi:hypothetical protein
VFSETKPNQQGLFDILERKEERVKKVLSFFFWFLRGSGKNPGGEKSLFRNLKWKEKRLF